MKQYVRKTNRKSPPTRHPLTRFMEKVSVQPNGCWLWTGSIDGWGYGQFYASSDERLVRAHRWAYRNFVGPIPDDRPELDHTCHTNDRACPGGKACAHRQCVNPAHLHPEPAGFNLQQGREREAAKRRAATHCQRGHAFTPENTRRPSRDHPEWRGCRLCHEAS